MRNRLTSSRWRIESRLRNEQGIALVLALVVMGTFSIMVVSVAAFMTSNERSSARDRDVARALNTAEAGLNNALAVLTQQDSTGTQPIGSTLGSTAFSIDGGSGTYSATKASALEWTISATGTSPNGEVTRKLELKLDGTQSSQSTQQSPVYGYGFFVNSTTGCTTIAGNSPVQVSVFVRNDLCLTGNAAITQPGVTSNTLTVYVGGKYTATANPFVGASPQKIQSFTAVGGCAATELERHLQHVRAVKSACEHVLLDPLRRHEADRGRRGRIRERELGESGLLGGLVHLRQQHDPQREPRLGRPAAEQCATELRLHGLEPERDDEDRPPRMGRDHQGDHDRRHDPHGRRAQLLGQSLARYTGFGSIYANGPVTTSGQAAICGPPAVPLSSSCVGNWDPAQGALSIVGLNGWSMSGQSEFNVIAYVNGAFSATGGAVVTGPAITDTATLSGNGKFATVTTVPPGTPGAATSVTSTTWKVLPGSWRQLLTSS